MQNVLNKPKTILDVWNSLPEGTLCQIVNDKLVMSPAPKISHQSVLGKIYFEISKFLEIDKRGLAFIAPFDVYFDKENILQPDLAFVANQNLHLLEDKGLVGVPDIVVEILSPSTAHIDLGDKREIYEQHGVKEYFIVDPNNKKVISYYLTNNIFAEAETKEGNFYSYILNQNISF
jgi:Uma2 family endonuclease